MKYYDYHLHSNISFDGVVPIDIIAQEALKKGMAGITLTEHVEWVGLTDHELMPDLVAYTHDITAARQKYPQLEIGMGIEMGLMPGLADAAWATSEEAPWDFIIGSAHMMKGCNLHNGEFTNSKSKKQLWHEYLVALKDLVTEFACFDVLGHLDLLRRDTGLVDRSLAYEEFAPEIDNLLLTLISRGKGLEVNTGALRYELAEPHPVASILKRYRLLGGEIITCGSDAHWQESMCMDIPLAYEYIQAAGFKHISLFKSRQLRQMPL